MDFTLMATATMMNDVDESFDVVDNAKSGHTPLFCHPDEEAAVAAILRASGIDDNSAYYIERDPYGHVVSLMGVGKQAPSSSTGSGPTTAGQQHHHDNHRRHAVRHWDMPAEVGNLAYLQKLSVYHCRSLPPEMMYLTQLRELSFKWCHEMQALPSEALASLSGLTDLRIHGPTSLRIIPSVRTLPSLKYFYCRSSCPHGGSPSAPTVASDSSYSGGAGGMIDFHIEDLLDDRIRFRNTLQLLELEGAQLTEHDVALLFGQVLPHFPNLHRVFLPNNHIRTLEPIVTATKRTAAIDDKTLPPTIRLRSLNLLGNPVLEHITYGEVEDKNGGETQPEPPPTVAEQAQLDRQQQYLLELVTLHEELTNLGYGFTESALCTTDILLMLDWNDAGRVLLSPDDPASSPPRFRPIPLSVWPTVLERASEKQGYHPTNNAVYHLLRYGPALGKRSELGGSNGFSGSKVEATGRKRKADDV